MLLFRVTTESIQNLWLCYLDTNSGRWKQTGWHLYKDVESCVQYQLERQNLKQTTLCWTPEALPDNKNEALQVCWTHVQGREKPCAFTGHLETEARDGKTRTPYWKLHGYSMLGPTARFSSRAWAAHERSQQLAPPEVPWQMSRQEVRRSKLFRIVILFIILR